MRNAFQTRILALALALATLGACIFAGYNLSDELSTDFPTDGITWSEVQNGLRADRVPTGSPGHRAGIREGDVLAAVNGTPTPRVSAHV
jgi:S1-C subfamily serine protease